MTNKVSFKDNFKYCKALGCNHEENIQWCCPELMPLCNKKSKFLKSMGEKVEKMGYSNKPEDIKTLDRLFEGAFSKNIVTAKHKNNESEYDWECRKRLFNTIGIGDTVKVETKKGIKKVKVTGKREGVYNNIGKPINKRVLEKIE